MRIILIDKYKNMCYYVGVNKRAPKQEERQVPMGVTKKHFKKRDAILECLRSTTAHPSADMVHEMLQAEHPDISLATVYRNLALFKQQGLISSVCTVNGVERFDGNTIDHVHFVCESCNAVSDLHEIHIPDSLHQEVTDCSGNQMHSCQITISGLCSGCINKENL